jgi:hypothetical protein
MRRFVGTDQWGQIVYLPWGGWYEQCDKETVLERIG